MKEILGHQGPWAPAPETLTLTQTLSPGQIQGGNEKWLSGKTLECVHIISSIQTKLNSKDLIPGQQHMTEDLGALSPL